MKLIIDIDDNLFTRLFDNGVDNYDDAVDMAKAIRKGIPLDKIRTEIEGKYRVVLKSTPKDDWAVRWNDCIDEVLQIIDKYRNEVSK